MAKLLNRQDIICLDKIVWKPGWMLVSKEEKELELEKIAKMQSWIVDGVSKTILELNSDSTLLGVLALETRLKPVF